MKMWLKNGLNPDGSNKTNGTETEKGLGASQIENKFSFFRESKDKPELRSGFFTEHLCSHFKKIIFSNLLLKKWINFRCEL